MLKILSRLADWLEKKYGIANWLLSWIDSFALWIRKIRLLLLKKLMKRKYIKEMIYQLVSEIDPSTYVLSEHYYYIQKNYHEEATRELVKMGK